MENLMEDLTGISFSELNIRTYDDDPDDYSQPESIWIEDKSMIRASYDLKLTSKLSPAVYVAKCSREYGIYCKKISVKSDELFLFSNPLINNLLGEIKLFWEKKDLYKKNLLLHKRGILLEGSAGVGKSSIITILSNEIIKIGGIVFKVDGPRNFVDFIEFLQIFRKIEPTTPIIIVIEDIDQYSQLDVELLDFLDGKNQIDHCIIIATTNNTEVIPNSYLRPSRIDLRIEIPSPCEKTRKEYFQYKGVPENDIENLVQNTEKLSLADLKEIYICVYLLNYTLDCALSKVKNPRKKRNYLSENTSKISL